jgi:transcriptional regulator GlxA family with amidase domain
MKAALIVFDRMTSDRIVDEGDVVTGSGVSTSIDLGLRMVERIAGRGARARAARQMCYPYQWK